MRRRRELLFQLIWWVAVAGVGWLTLRYALVWLLPFLLALGAASLLEPLIEAARRRLHLRRGFTAAVLTLVLVGGLLAVLIVLAVQAVEQAVSLVSSLPALLAALPDTLASLERRLESFCAACPEGVGRTAQGLLMGLPEAASRLAGQLSTAVLQGAARIMGALPRVLLACGTTVLAVFFTLSAYPEVMAFFRRQLGSELDRARGVKASVFATLGKWLKAECILLAVTFCQLLVGLLLIRQEYALLLAVLDFIPIIGAGTVMVPWAVIDLFLGQFGHAVELMVIWGIICVFRRVAEPKAVGSQTGLSPILSLVSIYVGMQVAGVLGMILGPVLCMVVINVCKTGLFDGLTDDLRLAVDDTARFLRNRPVPRRPER